MFYNKAKKTSIDGLKKSESSYNNLRVQANQLALDLYASRKAASNAIDRIEKYINTLANTPKEFLKDIGDVKLSIKEFNEAVQLEKESASANFKGGAAAIGGVGVGGAIATLGPTAAMAIATTFGTASTGTAIATLSGAAATNAALAWLGGGAIAAGGGGVAAGNAFLALAGPVGWTIAGVLAIGGGAFAAFKNKKVATVAHEKNLELQQKLHELRPKRAKMEELLKKTDKLREGLSVTTMVNTYPADYLQFNNVQKESLAALINNARSMGQLINERIA